jgi:transcription elongation factor GreB
VKIASTPADRWRRSVSTPNYITPNGAERLRRELEWLQREERPHIVSEVTEAAAMGDRSENAEYIYGKKRLRAIDKRMRFLMERLGNVIVVDPSEQEGPRVLFGATVMIANDEGDEKTWRIYGEDEVDVDRGILSWKSPLGRALLGKEEGDGVRYRAPGGMREVEIMEVRYEAQGPLGVLQFGT